jgi:hypothetical protein
LTAPAPFLFISPIQTPLPVSYEKKCGAGFFMECLGVFRKVALLFRKVALLFRNAALLFRKVALSSPRVALSSEKGRYILSMWRRYPDFYSLCLSVRCWQ